MKILLIEDDDDLAGVVGAFLEGRKHIVHYAQTGKVGLNLAATESIDAVVLDIMLPDISGYEICRHLRENRDRMMPILMLTAKDTLGDKLRGFESGADDYLVKPFSMFELEARLLALFNRSSFTTQAKVLRVGNLEFNQDSMRIRRGEREIVLQPMPRRILKLLMQASHRVVSLEELEHHLWPDSDPDRDALRVHIHTLRKALHGPDEPALLKTVRSIGYRLSEADADQA